VQEENFLEFFKDCGCCLVDLFAEPGLKITDVQGTSKMEDALNRLRELLSKERPMAVIVVIKRICKNVMRLIDELREKDGSLNIMYRCLRFPRGRYFKDFVERVVRVPDELIKQGILPGDCSFEK